MAGEALTHAKRVKSAIPSISVGSPDVLCNDAAGIAWNYAVFFLLFLFVGRRSLMDAHKHLHFKTFVMILIMIIAGPLGNVLLGMGMQSVGATSITSAGDFVHVVGRVFASPAIWMGIASLLAFFIANILVLSWADYSFVQPASSMAYGVVALLSMFLLGESITLLRWIGIAIICLGVFIVGRTHPRTTAHH